MDRSANEILHSSIPPAVEAEKEGDPGKRSDFLNESVAVPSVERELGVSEKEGSEGKKDWVICAGKEEGRETIPARRF